MNDGKAAAGRTAKSVRKTARLRGPVLFLWEVLLVSFLCIAFLFFMEAVQDSFNYYTFYSYYLFHLIFPPILFAVVTWSTGVFRPGRLLIAALVAGALMTLFFPWMDVVKNLWILGAGLLLALIYTLRTSHRKTRLPYRIRTPRPLPSDEEIEDRMDNERRVGRKYGSQRRHCRPIPVNRNWPIERI